MIDAVLEMLAAGNEFTVSLVRPWGPGRPCPTGVVAPLRREREVTTLTFSTEFGYLSVDAAVWLQYEVSDGTRRSSRLPGWSDGKVRSRELLEKLVG